MRFYGGLKNAAKASTQWNQLLQNKRSLPTVPSTEKVLEDKVSKGSEERDVDALGIPKALAHALAMHDVVEVCPVQTAVLVAKKAGYSIVVKSSTGESKLITVLAVSEVLSARLPHTANATVTITAQGSNSNTAPHSGNEESPIPSIPHYARPVPPTVEVRNAKRPTTGSKKSRCAPIHPISPLVLYLAPTKDLVNDTIVKLQRLDSDGALNVESLACCGGTEYPEDSETAPLSAVAIVAGTAGRLADMLKNGRLLLDSLRLFICDKADVVFRAGLHERNLKNQDLRTIVRYISIHASACRYILITRRLDAELKAVLSTTLMQVLDAHRTRLIIAGELSMGDVTPVKKFINVQSYADRKSERIIETMQDDLRFQAFFASNVEIEDIYTEGSSVLVICATKLQCEALDDVWKYHLPGNAGATATRVAHAGLPREDREANIKHFEEGINDCKYLFATPGIGAMRKIWGCAPNVILYDQPRRQHGSRLHDWEDAYACCGRVGQGATCYTLLDPEKAEDCELIVELVPYLRDLDDGEKLEVPEFMVEVYNRVKAAELIDRTAGLSEGVKELGVKDVEVMATKADQSMDGIASEGANAFDDWKQEGKDKHYGVAW